MTGSLADHDGMRALLRGLLVGADQPIESAEAWAARLLADPAGPPAPVVRRFVDQLGAEWFAARPPDPFCAALNDRVRAHLAAWHPGWPHLWGHILRVTGAALMLALDADLDPALVYALAICHDVTKLDELRTGEAHEITGAAFAREALRDRFGPSQVNAVAAAIRKEGDGALTRLLADADRLDKIGAAGVLRRVSTETEWAWLGEALARVHDDAAHFAPPHFAFSRDLAARKRAYLAEFLPLARQVAGEGGAGASWG